MWGYLKLLVLVNDIEYQCKFCTAKAAVCVWVSGCAMFHGCQSISCGLLCPLSNVLSLLGQLLFVPDL